MPLILRKRQQPQVHAPDRGLLAKEMQTPIEFPVVALLSASIAWATAVICGSSNVFPQKLLTESVDPAHLNLPRGPLRVAGEQAVNEANLIGQKETKRHAEHARGDAHAAVPAFKFAGCIV